MWLHYPINMDEVDILRDMDLLIEDLNDFIDWLQSTPAYWKLYDEFTAMRNEE